MLISSISIKNFRCIKDISVELEDLTAFVGRNGAGKSTILHAIATFYNIKAPISEDDFFNVDTSLPIEITVEYQTLSLEELTDFSRYVNDGAFAVSKKIELLNGSVNQRYYAATKQISQIAEIRQARNVSEKRNRWNELVKKGTLPGIGPLSKRGDSPDDILNAYEDAHPELAEWVPEEVQFIGPPNIGGGKLDNHTKFVYVPAVRDASDDFVEKKGTPLFQLLDFIVMRRFRSRKEVRLLQEEFSGRLKELYDPAKLTEFSDLAQEISGTLRLYVPDAELNLIVAEPKLPDIPSPSTIANLVEDDYAGSIDRKGHGLQRALIFSLLQHLATAEPIEENRESEQEDEVVPQEQGTESSSDKPNTSVAGQNGPALIIAIEEPELYQHPLRARHLAKILLNMSRESELGPGGRNQIMYTTHSPYFIDLERFDQLRIVRKYKLDENEPPCTSVASYSLQSAANEIARLTGRPSEEFTAQSFRARAHPVMTQTVNEGFFADVVVLVEGNTEVAALLVVADLLGSDWLSKGIAVVPVEGKTKIDRAAVVFKGLDIPTYIVFDGDCNHKGTREEKKEAALNRRLLKLCGGPEEDFPKSIASQDYTCFENDIESYCKGELTEPIYMKIATRSANAHGYSKPSDGIKNLDVVEDLINSIYDEGHTLPMLEQIVANVDQKQVLQV